MRKVFISYRREDSQDTTGRIADHLTARWGADCFFKDVESIPAGDDFRTVIAKALSECSVMVAIIGAEWLGAGKKGTRRIDNPDDYVRFELRTAMQRGMPIIPVLLDDAEMPKAESLPDDLREITFRNAVYVRPDPDFKGDVERLAAQLARRLDGPHFGGVSRRGAVLIGVATVLLLVAGLLGYRHLFAPDSGKTKVTVGLKQWVGYTPLVVAEELKLFPPNIEVEFKDVKTVADMHRELVDGNIDIALVLVESHVRAAEAYRDSPTNENRPVAFLKMDTSRGADGIVALPEITSVQQLGQGADGQTRYFLYQDHDVSFFLYRHLCNEANIEWRDIKEFGLSVDPEGAAELFRHPVDRTYYAAGTYEPHLSSLINTVPGAHALVTSESPGVAELVVDIMVTKAKFLEQNRNAISSLLDGWFAAVDILNDSAHASHRRALDVAYRFNGQPRDRRAWSVATWRQNMPCEETEYKQYVRGLTGQQQLLPWPNKTENIEFFKRPGGSASRFHSVFARCAGLRAGKNLAALDAASFDGSQEVFFRE